MGWQKKLDRNIRTVEELKRHIELSEDEERKIREVVRIHPMNISHYYISLINKEDPEDPIRKMIVPSPKELKAIGHYDTSGEKSNTKAPGIQHKYSQTALVLATNQCGSYCRFCFRKRLVGLPNEEIIERFGIAVDYIKKHKDINNVLITGGDPFILKTEVIENFLRMLAPIGHLDFIRFGTRTPVTFPSRIIGGKPLLKVLERYNKKKKLYVVTHFNHPREITPKSTKAIKLLLGRNIVISNQSVLMKGVNDDPDTIAELMNGLTRIGVVPYYLFQCRPVKRVKSHFQVPLAKGYKIVEAAKSKLNGHGKRFKYAMSHRTGKIEIVGIMDGYIYLKQHECKCPKNTGRFFRRKLNDNGGWLDDFQ